MGWSLDPRKRSMSIFISVANVEVFEIESINVQRYSNVFKTTDCMCIEMQF